MKRKCVICSSKFDERGSKKTCSTACSKLHHRNHYHNNKVAVAERAKQYYCDNRTSILEYAQQYRNARRIIKDTKCAHCRTSFNANTNGKFCSNDCFVAARIERRRQPDHVEYMRKWRSQNKGHLSYYNKQYNLSMSPEQIEHARQYARQCYRNNPEYFREKTRIWKNLFPEKQRAWRMLNRDRLNAAHKQKRAANSELFRERERQWRLKNPDKVKRNKQNEYARLTAAYKLICDLEACSIMGLLQFDVNTSRKKLIKGTEWTQLRAALRLVRELEKNGIKALT